MTLSENDRIQLISYRIEKATEALESAELLLESSHLSSAVNRIYYCIFYMVSALSLKHGYSTSKHRQLIGWFNRTYIATKIMDKKYGKLLKTAYEKRTTGDYSDLVAFEVDEINDLLEKTKEFILKIKEIIV